jgi:2-oxoglutarate dehydrogenase E1 component
VTQPSSQPPSSASSDPLAAFGPNEWLVDEIYQQYLRDPESVDKAWWDFFADYSPADGSGGGTASRGNGQATDADAADGQAPDGQASDGQASDGRAASGEARATGGDAGGRVTTDPPVKDGVDAAPPQQQAPAAEQPAATAGTAGTAATAPAAAQQPAASAAPVQQQQQQPEGAGVDAAGPASADRAVGPRQGAGEGAGARGAPEKAPEKAPAKPAAAAPETVPLKGPAARVVTNMQTSLTVPTATSVRAVPAKLLIDNRVVVNNHLKRGRGGKVSFTHVIGFAVVQALKAMPEMNYGYAEVDGKPTLVKPSTSTSASRSTSRSPTAPASCSCRPSSRRGDGLRAVLVGLRGRRTTRAQQQAAPPTTSPARRSA